ncbi:MAG: alpha/beta fold hydrolase [Acidimicrobiales bacterium]
MDRTSRSDHPPSLAVERRGDGPPLALVHGFTQTRHCWGPVADDLVTDHELRLVDAPGHGDSASIDVDLANGGVLIAEATGPATMLGYSMGGRFALHAALERPQLVTGLVLVGATAGIEDPIERAARVADDEARADHIERIGVDAFLDQWLTLPLFAGLSTEAAYRDERRRNTPAGLSSSLRSAGTGTQVPSWDRLPTLDMPVLVVAGADDTKFAALGQRMAAAIGPQARFVTIEDAGHTAHLERPERFLAVLRSWLVDHGL